MKNQKGFTLVEIIVAMAVGAIFVTCVIALISPTTKIFNRVETSADARLMTESILEEVRNIANYAGKLEAGKEKNTIVADETTISVDEDGYLIKTTTSGGETKSQKLFDPKFYAGKTVALTTAQDGKNCVDMTLDVLSDGRNIYSVDSRLKPVINMSDSFDKYTPEGMLRIVRGEIDKLTSPPPYGSNDKIYWLLKKEPSYYNGTFPEYKVSNLVSRDALQARYEASTGNTKKKYKMWLEQKTYLCCFITQTTLNPIIYITAEQFVGFLDRQPHAPAMAVYWEGKWYVQLNFGEKYLTAFNNVETKNMKAKIAEQGWIPLQEVLDGKAK